MADTPAREALEKWLAKRHPSDVRERLDAYRDEILRAEAQHLREAFHNGVSNHWNWWDAADFAMSCADFIDPDRRNT